MVFCATQRHALAIRDLINQAKTSSDPNYCARVTADDGKIGEQHLRAFQDNEKAIKSLAKTIKLISIVALSLLLPFGSLVRGVRTLTAGFGSLSKKGDLLKKSLTGIKTLIKSVGFQTFLLRLGFVKAADSFETSGLKLENYKKVLSQTEEGQLLLARATAKANNVTTVDIEGKNHLVRVIEELLKKEGLLIDQGELQNAETYRTIQQQNMLRKQSMDLMAAKAKENVFNQQDLATIQAQVAIRDAYFKATNQMLVADDGRLMSIEELKLQLQKKMKKFLL